MQSKMLSFTAAIVAILSAPSLASQDFTPNRTHQRADTNDFKVMSKSSRRRHPAPHPAPKPTPPPPTPPPPTPPPPAPAPIPGVSWPTATPESVGLNLQDLIQARDYINENVLERQCFLVIKNGNIVYEWYNALAKDPPLTPAWSGSPQTKPHHGFSMTKTVGGFLLLKAATDGGLDIDADITAKYGVKSPRPYAVTSRMMMAQVIAGEKGPGEMWRYDEMGNMWLHLFPSIIQSATGKDAQYWLDQLRSEIKLSDSFTWPKVNSQWFRGASGSCRDWARFGQLILNGGSWQGKQVIASKFIDDMQKPVRVAPYGTYANPCYGLLVWLNADKSKHPGCCWEASRLPDPKCNQETFMDGAVTDMTLNIGLYGQVVMTLQSANSVIVGFGKDLRPIEPARIGYYPGVCRALGLPCNTPPPVPKTRCDELLQCTGVSAQCFTGGAWSHQEPAPGGQKCVDCFRGRLPMYENQFPEAAYMVKNCPQGDSGVAAFDYIKCFCGLTGKNANPFAPWPATTTTTSMMSLALAYSSNDSNVLLPVGSDDTYNLVV